MSILKSFISILIISAVIVSNNDAQSYSRLINHGFDNQHLIRDFFHKNDSLIILMGHRCEDSFDCFTINNISVGQPDSQNYYLDLNDIKVGNNHALLVEEDRIIISSHDDNNGLDKIMISQLDLLYDSLITNEFLSEDSIRYINDGVIEYLGEYYVWGEGRDLTTNIPNGHVIKLDSSLTEILGQFYYSYGDKSSHLTDLQVQPDGHLSFLVQSDSDIDGVKDSLHIVKIDTAGQILDELSVVQGLGNIRRTFHTLRNGNYVIMNFRETIFGRVQCIDHQTHDVLWDYELPKGKFNEFNDWIIWNYHEADNGDIIACGFVTETIDDKWDKPQIVAYALRLTSTGEYVWLKRFLVPNETNPDISGPYHSNNFTHVVERDNGQLLLLGESAQINRQSPFQQHAWILALDENDCYKGNCSDTVIIDKRFNNKLKYDLGAKWTYETEDRFESIESFVIFEITDTLTMDGMPCYIFNDNDRFVVCTDGNKVLAPDTLLGSGYQLLYDFDSDISYSAECSSNVDGDNIVNEILVDSIKTEYIADGQLINVQYLNGICINTVGITEMKVYEGIGNSAYDPFPCFDHCEGIVDGPPSFFITKLRCFENSTENYRFVDYDCEKISLISSTGDVRTSSYRIYPNPTSGLLNVTPSPSGMSYLLTDVYGRVINQAEYSQKGIVLPEPGIYFLTLVDGSIKWTEKVVRY